VSGVGMLVSARHGPTLPTGSLWARAPRILPVFSPSLIGAGRRSSASSSLVPDSASSACPAPPHAPYESSQQQVGSYSHTFGNLVSQSGLPQEPHLQVLSTSRNRDSNRTCRLQSASGRRRILLGSSTVQMERRESIARNGREHPRRPPGGVPTESHWFGVERGLGPTGPNGLCRELSHVSKADQPPLRVIRTSR
jgi:hypothetical protein